LPTQRQALLIALIQQIRRKQGWAMLPVLDQSNALAAEMALELSAWEGELKGVENAQLSAVFEKACELWDRKFQWSPKLLWQAADALGLRSVEPADKRSAVAAWAERGHIEAQLRELLLADWHGLDDEILAIRASLLAVVQNMELSNGWWAVMIREQLVLARIRRDEKQASKTAPMA
jgi:hypothetical protein